MAAATGWPLPDNARERMLTGLRNALARPDPTPWLREQDQLDRRLALQAALGANLGTASPVVPEDLDALPIIALLDWVRHVLATPDGPLRRDRQVRQESKY